MTKSIIIIPSRLASTRLPNKPLIKINNKSLVMHVYDKAIKSQIGKVYVATCDKKIANDVEKNGGKFIMTSRSHTTGTDRVYEASKKLNLKKTDYIINVQGDEPMISPNDIKKLNKISKENYLNISTLAYHVKNKKTYKNRNIVKVITKKKLSIRSKQEALNFQRIINNNSYKNVYQHLGIYLYKFSALEKFINLKKTKNENNEKLEQLRAIDNNMKINVILANYFSSGIDTKKDLDEYKKLMNK